MEWIKTSEMLPPDGQEVLIWIDGADMPIQAYVNTDSGIALWFADPQWRDYTSSGEYPRDIKIDRCFEVTHWMPLPTPPKTKIDKKHYGRAL